MSTAIYQTSLHSLPLLARGKVRDNYAVGTDRILMVATDRLSAFDVVLDDPIPGKGQLLTQMALFWFNKLKGVVPNHLTGDDPLHVVARDEVDQVKDRSMLVRRLKPLPIEAVVRGYLAGSGWKEYLATQSVCGQKLPPALRLADKLPRPLFTPATKAEAGDHDENITYDQVVTLIGSELASSIQRVAIELYERAAEYALVRGIIIADTKFEFGLDVDGRLTLMDEILTPDSSRFWDVGSYEPGRNPPSFDKQAIRDWLEECLVDGRPWNKRAPAPALPTDVANASAQRYQEAFNRLVEPMP